MPRLKNKVTSIRLVTGCRAMVIHIRIQCQQLVNDKMDLTLICGSAYTRDADLIVFHSFPPHGSQKQPD
jgi:hypothetical protein